MTPETDAIQSYEPMAVVEKYETVIKYLYPIAQNLRMSKWQISPVTRGINFLGYRIWPRHKLLRKQSVTAAKRKIAKCIRYGDNDALAKFLGAWKGHASHADVRNLFNNLESQYGIPHHQ